MRTETKGIRPRSAAVPVPVHLMKFASERPLARIHERLRGSWMLEAFLFCGSMETPPQVSTGGEPRHEGNGPSARLRLPDRKVDVSG